MRRILQLTQLTLLLAAFAVAVLPVVPSALAQDRLKAQPIPEPPPPPPGFELDPALEPQVFSAMAQFVTAAYFAGRRISVGNKEALPTALAIEVFAPSPVKVKKKSVKTKAAKKKTTKKKQGR